MSLSRCAALTLAVVALAGWAQAADPTQTVESTIPGTLPSAPASEGLAPDLAPAPEPLRRAWALEGGFGDGQRTMGRFGANLGRNLIGVVSRDNLRPLLIGVGVAASGAVYDGRARDFFVRHQIGELDRVGNKAGSGQVVTPIAFGLLLAGRATSNTRFRAATYDITQAFLVNAAWTTTLKYAVRRTRPDGSDRLSFPSGHTSNAFAWATVANHHYGAKVGIPAYLAAGLIGASRMDKNVHHLSDVLAGAALGYVVGRTVVRQDGGPVRRRTHVTLTPAVGPSGTGVGMGVSVEF